MLCLGPSLGPWLVLLDFDRGTDDCIYYINFFFSLSFGLKPTDHNPCRARRRIGFQIPHAALPPWVSSKIDTRSSMMEPLPIRFRVKGLPIFFLSVRRLHLVDTTSVVSKWLKISGSADLNVTLTRPLDLWSCILSWFLEAIVFRLFIMHLIHFLGFLLGVCSSFGFGLGVYLFSGFVFDYFFWTFFFSSFSLFFL